MDQVGVRGKHAKGQWFAHQHIVGCVIARVDLQANGGARGEITHDFGPCDHVVEEMVRLSGCRVLHLRIVAVVAPAVAPCKAACQA